jgi:hypothetical protein
MFKNKSPELVLLLLQRAQLSIFRASTGKITNLPLPTSVVQDLEIKDEAAFTSAIKSFVSSQKINQGEVVILLDSSVYFSQQIDKPSKSEGKQKAVSNTTTSSSAESAKTSNDLVAEESAGEEQRKLFVQSMPFADVFSRIITVGKTQTIIAMNRDLYEPIVKVLNDSKLTVTHIYPIVVLVDLFDSEGFTPAVATRLLENREKYKIHNFLQPTHMHQDEMITTVLPTENGDKKRVLILVIFFVVLLGVFGGVWWWAQKSNTSAGQPRRGPAQPATGVAQVPTPSPVATATPSVATLEQLLTSTESAALTIEISDASGDTTSAQKLQKELTGIGFSDVTIDGKITQQTGSFNIVVNDSVSETIRAALIQQFEQWGYKIRFEVDPEQDTAIVITVTAP